MNGERYGRRRWRTGRRGQVGKATANWRTDIQGPSGQPKLFHSAQSKSGELTKAGRTGQIPRDDQAASDG
jgi:hypothetical protein